MLPAQLSVDLQLFIDGIQRNELASDDIDNNLLCRGLCEIYLSIP